MLRLEVVVKKTLFCLPEIRDNTLTKSVMNTNKISGICTRLG